MLYAALPSRLSQASLAFLRKMLIFFICLLIYLETVSCYLAQADLELMVLLLWILEYWGYRQAPPPLVNYLSLLRTLFSMT